MRGEVTAFSGKGRSLGYPTANVGTMTDLKDGVYFGFADMGKFHDQPALIFIGTPTTVGDKDRRVEAHLLDIPDTDYYGLNLSLSVMHYHRPNRTFKSVRELLAHMKQDENIARRWFKVGKPVRGWRQT